MLFAVALIVVLAPDTVAQVTPLFTVKSMDAGGVPENTELTITLSVVRNHGGVNTVMPLLPLFTAPVPAPDPLPPLEPPPPVPTLTPERTIDDVAVPLESVSKPVVELNDKLRL